MLTLLSGPDPGLFSAGNKKAGPEAPLEFER